MKQPCIIILCILSQPCFGQLAIRTFDKTDEDIYPWVTSISEGPSFAPKGQNTESEIVEFFRVAITTSEIYSGIYIEKGSMGIEGGGKKIIWRRMVDTDQLQDSLYNRGELRGEFTGVIFTKWLSRNSFALNIQGREYTFKDIENTTIMVDKSIKIKK